VVILLVVVAPDKAIPVGFVVLLLVVASSVVNYRIARRQFADHLGELITTVFDSATIITTGTGVSSSVSWSVLKRIQETKSMFLLYHTASAAVMVPKRFFRSPEEIERWRQLVASCMDPKLIEKPSFVGRWC
jgi:hypothetical protein